MINELIALQESIYNYYQEEESEGSLQYLPRVSFSKIGELYEINYYGEGYDDDDTIAASELEEGYNYGFCTLLDFLADHADQVLSLNFDGPDSGANGLRNWNFKRLTNSKVVFSNLLSFKVALTDVGHHNLSIIAENDEEDGMIAALVSKMPMLKELQLPSTPGEQFFLIPNLPIQSLIIQAGYDHQNFIVNLAKSSNLKDLIALDYSDKILSQENFSTEEVTSFDDYKTLFESAVMTQLAHLKLRDNRLKPEECQGLRQINKVQFLHIVQFPGKYI